MGNWRSMEEKSIQILFKEQHVAPNGHNGDEGDEDDDEEKEETGEEEDKEKGEGGEDDGEEEVVDSDEGTKLFRASTAKRIKAEDEEMIKIILKLFKIRGESLAGGGGGGQEGGLLGLGKDKVPEFAEAAALYISKHAKTETIEAFQALDKEIKGINIKDPTAPAQIKEKSDKLNIKEHFEFLKYESQKALQRVLNQLVTDKKKYDFLKIDEKRDALKNVKVDAAKDAPAEKKDEKENKGEEKTNICVDFSFIKCLQFC